MQICCRCKTEKREKEYNFRNKKLNIRQKSCKKCTRIEIQNHYNKNKKYYLDKAHRRNKENRDRIHKYIWEHLIKHPCVDCKENDPIVLDFDHKKDKIAALSEIIKWNYSIEKIKKEISKCEVRCANCHRKRTAKDFNWYKYKFASVA